MAGRIGLPALVLALAGADPALAEVEGAPAPALAEVEGATAPAPAKVEGAPAPALAEVEGATDPAPAKVEGAMDPALAEVEGATAPLPPEEQTAAAPVLLGAADAPPRLSVGSQIFAGYNPKAAVLRLSLDLRETYSRDPGSLLFNGAHVQGSLMADVTPAFQRWALAFQWLPLQALLLRAEYGLFVYHGYVSLLTYPDAQSVFSEASRYERDDEFAAVAHNVMLIAELRLKIWRIVAVSRFEGNFYAFEIDAPYAFEPWYGLLAARTDGILLNRSLLLYEAAGGRAGKTFRFGAYYSYRHSFEADVTNQQTGFAVVWEPADRLGPIVRPVVLVLAGMHIDDRWVEGRPVILGGIGGGMDLIAQD